MKQHDNAVTRDDIKNAQQQLFQLFVEAQSLKRDSSDLADLFGRLDEVCQQAIDERVINREAPGVTDFSSKKLEKKRACLKEYIDTVSTMLTELKQKITATQEKEKEKAVAMVKIIVFTIRKLQQSGCLNPSAADVLSLVKTNAARFQFSAATLPQLQNTSENSRPGVSPVSSNAQGR